MILFNKNIYVVIDKINCNINDRVNSFIHFHPDYNLSQKVNRFYLSNSSNNKNVILPFGYDKINHYYGEKDLIQGWYSPEFGKKYKNNVLDLVSRNKAEHLIGYFIYKDKEVERISDIKSELKDNGFALSFELDNDCYLIKEKDKNIIIEENKS